MNTIPPNDFSYFEMINDLVQKEPAEALDPEIMGSLAALGIIKGKPFEPDAQRRSYRSVALVGLSRTCRLMPKRDPRAWWSTSACGNMDCAPTAVDALPGITDTVGGRMTILADSIICRGSDISINVGHAARVVSA
ncbi:hypothetical protein GFB56_18830 [Ensifer sp. T173]|uniref:FMN-dependent dehydrogenase domain-containing protein n=1 Tax=Ensifer canadensis TaxID=555315 RepID=A0AAW4FNH7_9HYPH|nr:alpha-hydroxy-acid oxidizing protein [Ensifer canadensis]MBM3092842.1 hypothetical protein [Ensifer canadensis]UBI79793.1 alpha-hydroxy-acid oxidizing protein [Ensifer canadensis]